MVVLSNYTIIKNRITVYDIERVFDLYKKGVAVEKAALLIKRKPIKAIRELSRAKIYFAEIIKILTNITKVKRKHFRKINEIIMAADMNNKSGIVNPEQSLLKVMAWIGARINKTPHEIAVNSTSDEVKQLSEEIIKRNIENAVSMMKSYHIPKDYMKEIQGIINKLKNPLIAIAEKAADRNIDTFKILRKACFQPC